MPFKLPNFGDVGIANFSSALSGLFGNKATPTSEILLLPSNPLLTDYNIGKDLFKVRMKAKNHEITMKDEKGNDIKNNNDKVNLFEMEVLYNQPSLSINHSFEWGDSVFASAAENISNSAKFIKRGIDSASKLPQGKVFDIYRENIGGLEVAPVYKGSSKPSYTVNFILLAHSDPYKEVVLPAQLLTYLAYPQIKKNNIDSLLKILNGQTNSLDPLGKGNKDIANLDSLKGEDNDVDSLLEKLQQSKVAISEAFPSEGGNNWRYRSGSAPSFWSLESSNGLMDLDHCHISGLNIQYNSPWVAPVRSFTGGYKKTLQFANSIKSIVDSGAQGGESGIASMVNSIFPNVLDTGKSAITSAGKILGIDALKDFSGELDYGFTGGFPSYAEVSITFTSNYDKIFGEDWINQKNTGITVSKGQAGSAIFGAANSIIKNTFSK